MSSTTIQGLPRVIAVTVVPGGAPDATFTLDGQLDAADATLLSVRHVSADFVTHNDDVTDDFEIVGHNQIASTGGATPDAPDTTGDFLVVTYARPAAA